MTDLQYSTGTTWNAAGPWLITCDPTPARLVVLVDLGLARQDGKEVSLQTALWRVDNREYQTLRSEITGGGARMRLYAAIQLTPDQRAALAVDNYIDQHTGRVER